MYSYNDWKTADGHITFLWAKTDPFNPSQLCQLWLLSCTVTKMSDFLESRRKPLRNDVKIDVLFQSPLVGCDRYRALDHVRWGWHLLLWEYRRELCLFLKEWDVWGSVKTVCAGNSFIPLFSINLMITTHFSPGRMLSHHRQGLGEAGAVAPAQPATRKTSPKQPKTEWLKLEDFVNILVLTLATANFWWSFWKLLIKSISFQIRLYNQPI